MSRDTRDKPRGLFRRYERDAPKPHQPNSQLRAEQRADKDGKIVTRWVKDGSDNGASAALASHSAVGTREVPVPNNVNWDTASADRVVKLCASVSDGLTNPDKVWENFDFYTGLLESKHSALGLAALEQDNVGPKLREAWVKKHGAKIEDPSTYRNVGGDEGYQAYKDAFQTFRAAGEAAQVDWAFSDFGLESSPPGTSEHWDQLRASNKEYIEQKNRAEESGVEFDRLAKFKQEASSEKKAPKSFLDAMKSGR